MTEPNYDLLRVRQIVLEHLGEHPASVYLYGSRATGNARPTSDIDVAVLPRTPLPPVRSPQPATLFWRAPSPLP